MLAISSAVWALAHPKALFAYLQSLKPISNRARRVASFDKQALSAVKELMNRHTVPDPEDQAHSRSVFYSSFGWNGYREPGLKLRARGINQRSELELNFGDYLVKL